MLLMFLFRTVPIAPIVHGGLTDIPNLNIVLKCYRLFYALSFHQAPGRICIGSLTRDDFISESVACCLREELARFQADSGERGSESEACMIRASNCLIGNARAVREPSALEIMGGYIKLTNHD